jgi:hypothetical protein
MHVLILRAAASPNPTNYWSSYKCPDHNPPAVLLETVARARLRPATWTNYSYAVRVHIGPSLGSVRLRSLTPARVRRFWLSVPRLVWLRTRCGLSCDASNNVG